MVRLWCLVAIKYSSEGLHAAAARRPVSTTQGLEMELDSWVGGRLNREVQKVAQPARRWN